MQRLLRFRKLSLFLLLVLGLVIFFQAYQLTRNISPKDSEVIGGFIEWFGVLYGLVLAFVLVEAWTNFNRVVEEIDQEADALQMLDWAARFLGEELARPITLAIEKYAKIVVDANGNDEESNLFMQAIHELYVAVGKVLVQIDNVPVGMELMKRLNEALDTRGDRLQHARNKVPHTLWRALILTSIIWLLAFLGLGIQQIWLAIVITGSSVFIVSNLLYIIQDLGRPFDGAIKVDFSSFQTLLDNLEQFDELNRGKKTSDAKPDYEISG